MDKNSVVNLITFVNSSIRYDSITINELYDKWDFNIGKYKEGDCLIKSLEYKDVINWQDVDGDKDKDENVEYLTYSTINNLVKYNSTGFVFIEDQLGNKLTLPLGTEVKGRKEFLLVENLEIGNEILVSNKRNEELYSSLVKVEITFNSDYEGYKLLVKNNKYFSNNILIKV